MSNPALWTAIAGVIAAVSGLIAQIRHVKGPAHKGGPGGPAGKP